MHKLRLIQFKFRLGFRGEMVFHFLLRFELSDEINKPRVEGRTTSWHFKSLAGFSIKLWRDEGSRHGTGRENTLKAKFRSQTTMENVFSHFSSSSPFTEGAAIRAEASSQEDEDADGKRNLWFLIINCAYIKRKEEVGKTATLPCSA